MLSNPPVSGVMLNANVFNGVVSQTCIQTEHFVISLEASVHRIITFSSTTVENANRKMTYHHRFRLPTDFNITASYRTYHEILTKETRVTDTFSKIN